VFAYTLICIALNIPVGIFMEQETPVITTISGIRPMIGRREKIPNRENDAGPFLSMSLREKAVSSPFSKNAYRNSASQPAWAGPEGQPEFESVKLSPRNY
jgi:hypothetical protein